MYRRGKREGEFDEMQRNERERERELEVAHYIIEPLGGETIVGGLFVFGDKRPLSHGNTRGRIHYHPEALPPTSKG